MASESRERAAALLWIALGLAPVVGAGLYLWKPWRGELASGAAASAASATPPASDLAVVAVDDSTDPYAVAAADTVLPLDLPADVSLEPEQVPAGPGHTEARRYPLFRGAGVSPAARAWLGKLVVPAGRHWAFAKHERFDDATGRNVADGWRAYLLDGPPLIGSKNLRRVAAERPPSAFGWQLTIELDEPGAKRFEQATRDHLEQRLAIVVDGVVMSAPVVKTPISGGRLIITLGSGAPEAEQEREARAMAAALSRAAHP